MAAPVRAGIDHEVGATLLPLAVELAVAVEHGGRHRKDAAVDRCGHGTGFLDANATSLAIPV
jgi:hypothetical protein